MTLPLEPKPKCKSDNEAKNLSKVMTLDKKIKILDTFGGDMSLTFR